jgi:hypothetical protein
MCVGVNHLQVIFADLVYVVFSNVFKCFLCVRMMSMVFVMAPYFCPVFNMWFEYPDLPL